MRTMVACFGNFPLVWTLNHCPHERMVAGTSLGANLQAKLNCLVLNLTCLIWGMQAPAKADSTVWLWPFEPSHHIFHPLSSILVHPWKADKYKDVHSSECFAGVCNMLGTCWWHPLRNHWRIRKPFLFLFSFIFPCSRGPGPHNGKLWFALGLWPLRQQLNVHTSDCDWLFVQIYLHKGIKMMGTRSSGLPIILLPPQHSGRDPN